MNHTPHPAARAAAAHAEQQQTTAGQRARRAILASLGTIAHAAVWSAPDADDTNQLETAVVELSCTGMGRRSAAYVFRGVAARLDEQADAVGEAPLDDDAAAEADARNEERYAPHPITGSTPVRPSAEQPAACGRASATGQPRPDHSTRTIEQAATEQRENVDFNNGDMVAALRDALLDVDAHTPATAEAAARVLLAAHTRELAAAAREHTTQRGNEMRKAGDRSRRATCDGMRDIARMLDARATLLDPQPEEEPAEQPAFAFPALAVPCPHCKAARGQLCTSHGGTRDRHHNVHQARTAAYREQEAGR